MTTPAPSHDLKTACVKWLSSDGQTYDIALTLNMRAGISREQAQQAARHFWQRVDCAVHGSKAKRKNQRVHRICVLEGDHKLSNFHYHAAVMLPQGHKLEAFQQQLLDTWHQLNEAGRYSVVRTCHHSQGWLDYICKRMKHSTDVLCLATSHFPA